MKNNKNKMKIFILPFIILIIGFATFKFVYSAFRSDNTTIKGNKKYVQKTYLDAEDFTAIDVNKIGSLEIVQAEKNSVSIEIDENLLPFVEVKLENKKVFIQTTKTINSNKFNVIVRVKNLESIKGNSTGSIQTSNSIKRDKLIVEVNKCGSLFLNVDIKELTGDFNGTGSVDINGKSEKAFLKINKVGSVNTENLIVKEVDINATAIGSLHIYADSTLSLETSKIGSININGKPKIKKYSVN